MKKLGRILVGLFVMATLAVTLGALLPRPLWPTPRDQSASTRHILLLKNPIHTDIAIPVDDAVLRRFDFLLEAGMPIDMAEVR